MPIKTKSRAEPLLVRLIRIESGDIALCANDCQRMPWLTLTTAFPPNRPGLGSKVRAETRGKLGQVTLTSSPVDGAFYVCSRRRRRPLKTQQGMVRNDCVMKRSGINHTTRDGLRCHVQVSFESKELYSARAQHPRLLNLKGQRGCGCQLRVGAAAAAAAAAAVAAAAVPAVIVASANPSSLRS